MPISSSTVFHFTNNPDHLINILTNDFRPRFCLEDLSVVMPDMQHHDELQVAFPMVCFCDIPLSQVSVHLKHYGSYGIGLTKGWAIRSGLSPVLYVIRGSPLAERLYEIAEQLSKFPGAKLGSSPELDRFHDLSVYLKPYEGLSPKDPNGAPWRFYDEREWRYVPDVHGFPFRYGLLKEEVDDPAKRDLAQEMLWQKQILRFQPDDIKYIIVDRESEILGMIARIEQIKARFEPDVVQLLKSRLISSDQIREDF